MKRLSSNRIDMLNGSLWDKILLFALPIAGSSILQQLFNSADVAVAGRFAGDQALAAVGGNTPIINMMINLFVGLSVGANVVIANYIGKGEKEKIQDAVHSAVALALISGFILMAAGQVIARPVLVLIDTPEDVLDMAVLYMRIYFAGMPIIMMYNFVSAILRSIGDTRRPLYALIVSGVINVILNMIFVIVFKMGVAGVALATVIANVISAAMVTHFLLNEEEFIRLYPKKIKVHRDVSVRIAKIGMPAGLQGVVFSFSNIVIQSAINGFGTFAEAGSAAAVNYEFFTYFIVNAFGQATVTFVSQNYGAGKLDRCRRAYNISLIFCTVISIMSCVVFVGFKEFFAGLYTTGAAAIGFALIRMVHVESLEWMVGFYELSASALRGMGWSLLPALLTILGTCVVRVIWVMFIFPLVGTFEFLMDVYPVTWVITTSMVMGSYFVIRRRIEKKLEAEKAAEAVCA